MLDKAPKIMTFPTEFKLHKSPWQEAYNEMKKFGNERLDLRQRNYFVVTLNFEFFMPMHKILFFRLSPRAGESTMQKDLKL